MAKDSTTSPTSAVSCEASHCGRTLAAARWRKPLPPNPCLPGAAAPELPPAPPRTRAPVAAMVEAVGAVTEPARAPAARPEATGRGVTAEVKWYARSGQSWRRSEDDPSVIGSVRVRVNRNEDRDGPAVAGAVTAAKEALDSTETRIYGPNGPHFRGKPPPGLRAKRVREFGSGPVGGSGRMVRAAKASHRAALEEALRGPPRTVAEVSVSYFDADTPMQKAAPLRAAAERAADVLRRAGYTVTVSLLVPGEDEHRDAVAVVRAEEAAEALDEWGDVSGLAPLGMPGARAPWSAPAGARGPALLPSSEEPPEPPALTERTDLTVSHSADEGTLIRGDTKRFAEAIKRMGWGFKWWREGGAWYRQRSRGAVAPTLPLERIAEKLRAAGATVTVEAVPEATAAEGAAVLAQAATERAEVLEERAARARAELASAHRAEKAITEHIPLGQPILVGHHSEARARRDRDRIHALAGKQVAALTEAEALEARARAARREAEVQTKRATIEAEAPGGMDRVADEITEALKARVREFGGTSVRVDYNRPGTRTTWKVTTGKGMFGGYWIKLAKRVGVLIADPHGTSGVADGKVSVVGKSGAQAVADLLAAMTGKPAEVPAAPPPKPPPTMLASELDAREFGPTATAIEAYRGAWENITRRIRQGTDEVGPVRVTRDDRTLRVEFGNVVHPVMVEAIDTRLRDFDVYSSALPSERERVQTPYDEPSTARGKALLPAIGRAIRSKLVAEPKPAAPSKPAPLGFVGWDLYRNVAAPGWTLNARVDLLVTGAREADARAVGTARHRGADAAIGTGTVHDPLRVYAPDAPRTRDRDSVTVADFTASVPVRDAGALVKGMRAAVAAAADSLRRDGYRLDAPDVVHVGRGAPTAGLTSLRVEDMGEVALAALRAMVGVDPQDREAAFASLAAVGVESEEHQRATEYRATEAAKRAAREAEETEARELALTRAAAAAAREAEQPERLTRIASEAFWTAVQPWIDRATSVDTEPPTDAFKAGRSAAQEALRALPKRPHGLAFVGAVEDATLNWYNGWFDRLRARFEAERSAMPSRTPERTRSVNPWIAYALGVRRVSIGRSQLDELVRLPAASGDPWDDTVAVWDDETRTTRPLPPGTLAVIRDPIVPDVPVWTAPALGDAVVTLLGGEDLQAFNAEQTAPVGEAEYARSLALAPDASVVRGVVVAIRPDPRGRLPTVYGVEAPDGTLVRLVGGFPLPAWTTTTPEGVARRKGITAAEDAARAALAPKRTPYEPPSIRTAGREPGGEAWAEAARKRGEALGRVSAAEQAERERSAYKPGSVVLLISSPFDEVQLSHSNATESQRNELRNLLRGLMRDDPKWKGWTVRGPDEFGSYSQRSTIASPSVTKVGVQWHGEAAVIALYREALAVLAARGWTVEDRLPGAAPPKPATVTAPTMVEALAAGAELTSTPAPEPESPAAPAPSEARDVPPWASIEQAEGKRIELSIHWRAASGTTVAGPATRSAKEVLKALGFRWDPNSTSWIDRSTAGSVVPWKFTVQALRLAREWKVAIIVAPGTPWQTEAEAKEAATNRPVENLRVEYHPAARAWFTRGTSSSPTRALWPTLRDKGWDYIGDDPQYIRSAAAKALYAARITFAIYTVNPATAAGLRDKMTPEAIAALDAAGAALAASSAEDAENACPLPPGIKLYGYQRAGINYALARKACLIADEMGLGKAQPMGAKVLTPRGWVLMGDVTVGMEVIGSSGAPARVVGVFPQGERDVYRVTFTDGATVECCDEHLWSVNTAQRIHAGRPFAALPLAEIRASLHTAAGHRHFVPMMRPAQFAPPPVPLPLDPYLVGYLLGNGGLTQHAPQVTIPDAETVERIAAKLPDGVSLRPHAPGAGCIDYRISTGVVGNPAGNPVTDALRALGMMGEPCYRKRVPEAYRFLPVEERIALLRGIMDADGSITSMATVEFSSTSEALADDVRELVETLGGVARKHGPRVTSYTYDGEKREGRPSWRLVIAMPPEINPFQLGRKASRFTREKYPPSRAIASVEPVGREPVQCIAVDAADHLYVTDHCAVTHNTPQAIVTMACDPQVRRVLVIVPASLQLNWSREIVRFSARRSRVVRLAGYGAPRKGETKEQARERVNAANAAALAFHDATPAVPPTRGKRGGILDPGRPAVPADDMVWCVVGYEGAGTENAVPVLDGWAFDAAILDEAQHIKNPEAKRTKRARDLWERAAQRRLLLTGTPILNRLGELYTMLSFIDPATYPPTEKDQQRFVNRYSDTYIGPVVGAKRRRDLESEMRQRLMVRRLKDDVLKDLPPKRWSIVALEPDTEELREAVAAWSTAKAKYGYSDNPDDDNPETDEVQAIHADLLLAEAIGDRAKVRELSQLLKLKKGPGFTEISRVRALTGRAKVEKVVEHIASALESKPKGQQKIIAWAHHIDVARGMVEGIRAAGWTAEIAYGSGMSPDARAAVVDRFQTTDLNVAVCTIGGMGSGHTMTAASHVVFCELSWTPALNAQAEDRAHRIGQKNSVLVEYIVLDGSIDARMMYLLKQKEELAESTLDGQPSAEGPSIALPEAAQPKPGAALDPSQAAATVERDYSAEVARVTKRAMRSLPTAYVYSAEERRKLANAMNSLASVCDGAKKLDDCGFAAADVRLGWGLASLPLERWNDMTSSVAHTLAIKYRGQLGGEVIERMPGGKPRPKSAERSMAEPEDEE